MNWAFFNKESMSIEEIHKSYQNFICAAICAKYNDFEETDVNPALEELLETLNRYKIDLKKTNIKDI